MGTWEPGYSAGTAGMGKEPWVDTVILNHMEQRLENERLMFLSSDSN